jgi:hypothetical protein
LEFQVVISSWQANLGKISPGGNSSVLVIYGLDSKGNVGKNKEIMFQISVGRSEGEFCDALDQMGVTSFAKVVGGWGLKNIHCFSTALATKMGWRLISSNNLWSKVIQQKYINPDSVVDWIRRPKKVTKKDPSCGKLW